MEPALFLIFVKTSICPYCHFLTSVHEFLRHFILHSSNFREGSLFHTFPFLVTFSADLPLLPPLRAERPEQDVRLRGLPLPGRGGQGGAAEEPAPAPGQVLECFEYFVGYFVC